MTDSLKALEAKLTRKYEKKLKDHADRIEGLEQAVMQLGAWVASRRREEAQRAADANQEPVVTTQDETGEVWIPRRPV